LSHLPEDEAINIGLAFNGRERTPTRAKVQDRFYGNFNPTLCVSLPRGQITNSDVAFIASVVKMALKEQLEPEFIAREVKTLEIMDCGWFQPDARRRFTSWSKDLIGEDLDFGSSLSKMRRRLPPSFPLVIGVGGTRGVFSLDTGFSAFEGERDTKGLGFRW
jgi:hypothetical protein